MEASGDQRDRARSAVAQLELTAQASAHLTDDVAVHLPFPSLGPFKNLLKQFFSTKPWTAADDAALSALVTPHVGARWWEHELGHGLTLAHGIAGGEYRLEIRGEAGMEPSIFDRVFAGPVIPEATPHPGKVKFVTGGTTAPGRWYRRGDETDDHRVTTILAADGVSDVMVAGDFVTVGLVRTASWEDRLDDVLELVTELFYDPGAGDVAPAERTRDELVGEGLRTGTPAELHLLDPDDPDHRRRLTTALRHPEAETRRVALATLAQSGDPAFVAGLLAAAYEDEHRIVRRMAIDAGADLATEEVRRLFERATRDPDAWVRWKAVRGLREIGATASRAVIEDLADDDDFQVRLEAAAALRETP